MSLEALGGKLATSDQSKTPQIQRVENRLAALSIREVACLFGLSEEAVLELASRRRAPARHDFYSIAELAERWRCSRGTVYNRLRAAGAEVLDFAPRGKKGKKAVPVSTVLQMESRHMRRLR